jgi:hypothetical protein
VLRSARYVMPEILDDLPPTDARARRSRDDLRRLHWLMGTAGILAEAIGPIWRTRPPRRILELGAGDGTLMLRVARLLPPIAGGVELSLLDRHDVVDRATVAAYAAIGWTARILTRDALDWARDPVDDRCDLCVTLLFLHHFGAEELRGLLRAVEARVGSFVACEPRRGPVAAIASRLVTLVGANSVTRADAVTSVAAGFAGRELSALWPSQGRRWELREFPARAFCHGFTAARTTIGPTGGAYVARS